MRHSLLYIVFCLFLATSHAQGVRNSPIIIDIDNPGFRKLITAVPDFVIEGEGSLVLQKASAEYSQVFSSLLKFTGMFQIMNQEAYSSLLKKKPSQFNGRPQIAGFEGVDLLQWKALGVESLTVVRMRMLSEGIRLEFRTADIVKGERILGKSYVISSTKQMDGVIKKYIDRLLEVYTGKPGIFSTRIAFVGRKAEGADKQIFTCDIDGKNLKQMTFTKANHLAPAWSPDGKKIIFTSYENRNPDLYMIDVASGKKEKISGHHGINSGADYAKNGKLIAYTGSIRGNAEIFISPPESEARRKLLLRGRGIDVDPQFSPDGKWLIFVSGRYGNPHIFKASLAWNEGGDHVKVTGDQRLTYAGWYNATPAWSPDSQKIAFAGFDREINRFDLFLMNHDGSQLERLTIKSGDNESPAWSPNGQLIMYHSNRIGTSDVKGQSQLYIMNRDGSDQREISTGLWEAQTPKWGPYTLD